MTRLRWTDPLPQGTDLPVFLPAAARLLRTAADERELALPALLQAPRDDHFADEHTGPELDAQPPIR